jgi:GTP-dependent phosphoenolpyruvate carboxykinase
MTKFLEGITSREETALMVALQKELIRFKCLLKKDGDYWFYKEKVDALYSLFDKMGYDREFVDKHIIS